MSEPKILTNEKLSIILDNDGINKYRKIAQQLQLKYGNQTMRSSNLTGNQYYNKIEEMINVATQIINKNLIPNIFDVIPLKKDGTFFNHNVVIFYNHCTYFAESTYEYLDVSSVILCLTPYYKSSKIDNTKMILTLAVLNTAKKLYPLLDSNLHVQDIKTKTKYIPNHLVQTGAIYKEKSGTQYLYLGQIDIRIIPTQYLQNPQKPYPHDYTGYYTYVRITKAIKEYIQKSTCLDDLFIFLIQNKKTGIHEPPSLSIRYNPRKFTEQVEFPFCQNGWKNVNIQHPSTTDVKIGSNILYTYTDYNKIYNHNEEINYLIDVFLPE